MKFFRQVKVEFVNILRSKFLLIIALLVVLAAVAIPIITAISPPPNDEWGYPVPMPAMERAYAYDMKGGYIPPDWGGQEPITVDGVTITPDNPFYWNITDILRQREVIETGGNDWEKIEFETPEAASLLLKLLDSELEYYLRFAKAITKHTDYRIELQWYGTTNLYDKFAYEHNDVEQSVLKDAMKYKLWYDDETFKKKFFDITSEERLAELDKLDSYLKKLYDILDKNDFPLYVGLRIEQEEINIVSMEEQIKVLEQNIIDNPSLEIEFSRQIEDIKRNIDYIRNNAMWILQLRLEKNIIPGEDTWKNTAVQDIEQARSWLQYSGKIITEEEFNSPEYQYLKQQHGTYHRYVAEIQAQINEYNNKELVATASIDTDKPDMIYVLDGPRSQTVKFLYYSIIVALFGVLVGGWIMGSEFQLGTIRLLLIRPKTRTKILMAKFLAGLLLCLGIYVAGVVLGIVTNGICFGFSDFAFPNHTVAGPVGFFAVFIPDFLACSVSIIFAFCVAFMLSMLVKNIAVSIAIPVIAFVGCYLLMDVLKTSRVIEWIAYTPIPYVNLSAFYMPYKYIHQATSAIQLINRGVPLSDIYGIILLLVLSAVCVVVSIFTFRKKDITN